MWRFSLGAMQAAALSNPSVRVESLALLLLAAAFICRDGYGVADIQTPCVHLWNCGNGVKHGLHLGWNASRLFAEDDGQALLVELCVPDWHCVCAIAKPHQVETMRVPQSS